MSGHMAKKIAWIGLCCGISLSLGALQPNCPQQGFYALQKHYQLEVSYEDPILDVPYEWQRPPFNMQMIPLEPAHYALAEIALTKALKAYPDKVIQDYLKKISLSKQMYLYGEKFAGTYIYFDPQIYGPMARHEIYLAESDSNDPYLFLIDTFHHEFSSVLLRSKPFPEAQWRAVHAKEFAYLYENQQYAGFEALKEGLSSELKSDLFAQGFLSGYSQASFEEDLNVFSAYALGAYEYLATLAQQHARLAAKLKIWLNYYNSIDPGFQQTEAFRFYKKQGFQAKRNQ